jgi:PhnB protein
MTTINPYLTFNGTCEAAFDLYKSVFGGDFTMSGKFKDMPADPKYPVSEAEGEKIMHISLPISKETTLMGSDTSEAFGKTTTVGDNVSISINCDSVEETTRIFNELSAGGTIKMPLEKTFWGAFFGMFIDKFGIHWMVNCELEEHKDFEKANRKDGK